MSLAEQGALGFGLVIGWFLYFVNRYRRSDASFADITTVLGAVGGAAVTSLFPGGTALFGAYGVGLAIGFFGYFLVLVVMVGISDNFGIDYFLDGRRKEPGAGEGIPGEIKPPTFAFDDPGGAGGGGSPAVQAGIAAGVAAATALSERR
ncbi:MAG: hypothetical protein ABW194_06170 [Novosphingobium sp.]